MNQQLATVDEHDAAIMSAMTTSIYPGAKAASIGAALQYCKAAGLDPMTKPVHIVPMKVKTGEKPDGKGIYESRDVILPGVSLYRTKAHRTGSYAGTDAPVFGPTLELKSADGKSTWKYPEWCELTVYRIVAGVRCPFPVRVYWLEAYATASRYTTDPNEMWGRRAYGQVEKCAEALALRKAFPEETGALPTAEEMEGRTAHLADDEPTAQVANREPQSKSERAAAAAAATEEAPKPPKPPIDAEFTEQPKQAEQPKTEDPAPAAATEPGYHGLSDSQTRLVRAAAKRGGIEGTDAEVDAAVFASAGGGVSLANLNDVLAKLRG